MVQDFSILCLVRSNFIILKRIENAMGKSIPREIVVADEGKYVEVEADDDES